MRTALSRLGAIGLLLALAGAIAVYPGALPWLAAPLAAYAALLWWRPQLWLLLVPALLPVFDLAPWTGWFFLEELDLLLLTTCAVGYWRLAASPPQATLPRFYRVALGLVALSFLVSMVIGLLPLAPLDANAFSNYLSHYNSLRIAKGLGWALLLLPLLLRSAGPALIHLRRLFVPGMLAGLALCCLAVVWERLLFPGLFNFTADYRPTAPFSAMHTGGAALDAYLAIGFPLLAVWLLGAQSRRVTGAALLLLLGIYAGMATFSRDIYLAYATSGTVLGLLLLVRRLRSGRARPLALLSVALLLALAAWMLMRVFGSSGYRGLAAALLALGAAVALAGAGLRLRALVPALGVAAPLLLAVGALYALVPKGAYLACALAAAVFSLGAACLLAGPARARTAQLLMAGAFPAMLASAMLVAINWGGQDALGDMAMATGLALLLPWLNRIAETPLWQLDRATVTSASFSAIVLAIVIPISGSYYSGERFATVGSDMDVRLGHWSEAFAMMDPDWRASTFGMGLGSYPATYFWKNSHGETPGSHSYVRDPDGNQALRLGAPAYARGYGEVLRMLQQLDLQPGQSYQLALDVRRSKGEAQLLSALCERWLIFPQHCAAQPIKLAPADGAWHHYSVTLTMKDLTPGLLAPPTRLELAADGRSAALDVDNVSVRDASGRELLRNGSFDAGHDWWFFSSDRNHFPWHAKNFVVNSYFETGWFGLAALGLLGLYAAGTLALRALDGDVFAGASLAALSGFMVVGLFDSLFDVPRLTLVCFLLLSAACLQAPPPVKQRVRVKRVRAAQPEPEPEPAPD